MTCEISKSRIKKFNYSHTEISACSRIEALYGECDLILLRNSLVKKTTQKNPHTKNGCKIVCQWTIIKSLFTVGKGMLGNLLGPLDIVAELPVQVVIVALGPLV